MTQFALMVIFSCFVAAACATPTRPNVRRNLAPVSYQYREVEVFPPLQARLAGSGGGGGGLEDGEQIVAVQSSPISTVTTTTTTDDDGHSATIVARKNDQQPEKNLDERGNNGKQPYYINNDWWNNENNNKNGGRKRKNNNNRRKRKSSGPKVYGASNSNSNQQKQNNAGEANSWRNDNNENGGWKNNDLYNQVRVLRKKPKHTYKPNKTWKVEKLNYAKKYVAPQYAAWLAAQQSSAQPPTKSWGAPRKYNRRQRKPYGLGGAPISYADLINGAAAPIAAYNSWQPETVRQKQYEPVSASQTANAYKRAYNRGQDTITNAKGDLSTEGQRIEYGFAELEGYGLKDYKNSKKSSTVDRIAATVPYAPEQIPLQVVQHPPQEESREARNHGNLYVQQTY